MEEMADKKLMESLEKSGVVCLKGLYLNLSHVEILDICISMTQIMFAWAQKDCIKSKVGEVC